MRKLKKNKKGAMRRSKKSVGKEALDGGTTPSDNEIRACNELYLKNNKDEAQLIWEIGEQMGVLEATDRDKGIDRLLNWEIRDAAGTGISRASREQDIGSESDNEFEEVWELNQVPNADA